MKKGIVTVLIILVIGILVFFLSPGQVYKKENERGEQALKEKNYEQAIIHFEKAYAKKENKEIKEKLKLAKNNLEKAQFEALNAYFEAIQTKDFEKAWTHVSKEMRAKLTKTAYIDYQSLENATKTITGITIEMKKNNYVVSLVTKESQTPVVVKGVVKKENRHYKFYETELAEHFNEKLAAAYISYGKYVVRTYDGDYRTAREFYVVATQYDSSNVEAYRLIAESYVKTGEIDLAITQYALAIKKAKAKKENTDAMEKELARLKK